MRNLLLFAHECAPRHRPEWTIVARRPAAFARFLGEFGWRTVVIACDADARRSARREDIPGIVSAALERFRATPEGEPVVLAVPSLSDDGILDRAWLALAGRGGVPGGLRRSLTALRATSGDWSRSWQPVARAVANAVAGEVRFDACLGEHPPDAGLFLARWFHLAHGVPWAVDFGAPALAGSGRAGRALRAPVLRRLLRSASFSVAVTPHRAHLDEEILRLRSHCIPDGFIPGEFPAIGGTRTGDGELRIVHTGGLVGSEDPAIFMEGLREFVRRDPDAANRVRFRCPGAAGEPMRRAAEAAGVLALCERGDEVEGGEALRRMADADLLLLLSASDRGGDPFPGSGLHPGTTMEHLGAARPILCVPGDGDLLDELLGETRTGTVARSPAEVADALERALEFRRRGEELPYEPDGNAVSRFERRRQAGTLAGLLDGVVRNADSPPPVPVADAAPRRARILALVHNPAYMDQRVQRHGSALAAAGHDVLVVGVASRRAEALRLPAAEPGLARRLTAGRRDGTLAQRITWFRNTMLHHIARAAWRRGARWDAVLDRAVCPALGEILAATRDETPDLVYCNDLNTVPVGLRIARRAGCPLVYDAHEYYQGENARMDRSDREAVRRMESRALAASAASITVSSLLARRIAEDYGVPPPVVVRNVPPAPPLAAPGGTPPAHLPLRILYHSANLSLHGRQLRDLLDAVAEVDAPVSLQLRGNTTPPRRREIHDYLADRIPRTRWSLKPAAPFDELMAEAAHCDVGVVLNSGVLENERLTLPNKVFEYMLAGLAVATFRTDPVAEVVVSTDCGLVTEENTSRHLAAILRRFALDRDLVDRCRRNGFRASRERHCWEVEAPLLVETVRKALAGGA